MHGYKSRVDLLLIHVNVAEHMAGGIRPAKLKSRAYMYIHNFCHRPYLVGEGGGGGGL